MKKLFSIIFIVSFLFSQAQENNSWFQTHIDFNGYINHSNILIFHDMNDLSSNNLIHNRINFKYYINDKFSFNAGLRNRIYYGDWSLNPLLRNSLKKEEGLMKLTRSFINENRLFEISNVDRLYLDLIVNKIEFILGRQRINWGINNIWNPLDIFNASNFLDMDYPEKPGVDAFRVLYDIDGMSDFEFAFSSDKNFDKTNQTWAFKYANSIRNMDIQLQTGYYKEYWFAGLGWAGNLEKIGLKSEWNFYKKSNSNVLIGSLEADYSFRNGMNWIGSLLYNGGYTNETIVSSLFNPQKLDAMHLFPSRLAVFSQLNGDFGPAWTWSLGALYGENNRLFILIPSVKHSIADQWDLEVFAQSFFAEIPGLKQTNIINLRWSYHF